MADGGGVLTFRAIPLEEAIRHSATERLYHPLGVGAQDTAAGITQLRRMALDIPVYLVRLEAGYIQKTLKQVSADLISEGRLVEQGVTGYAAAFEKDGQRVLVIVSRAPLRRPVQAEPVVWRQRDHTSPEPPPPAPPPELPPAPPPRKKRSKGNPETRKARKKARKQARWQRREQQ